jgi:sugar phosphate permease
MKWMFLAIIMMGISSASYGYSGIIDSKVPDNIKRPIFLLGGIIAMGIGLLLFSVPNFFTASPY